MNGKIMNVDRHEKSLSTPALDKVLNSLVHGLPFVRYHIHELQTFKNVRFVLGHPVHRKGKH